MVHSAQVQNNEPTAPGERTRQKAHATSPIRTIAFAEILSPETFPERRETLRMNLLTYCKRGTEARPELRIPGSGWGAACDA